MIRITYTIDLPEMWGADECFDGGGKDAVVELIYEDVGAFLEGGRWSVEKIES